MFETFAWATKRLGELVYRPIAYGVLKPSDNTPGGIPMFRINDISDSGQLVSDQMHHITPDLDHEFRRTKLNAGDLLFSVVGTIGRIHEVGQEHAGANISRAFCVLGIKDAVLRRFIAQYLQSGEVRRWMEVSSTGNAQKVLNVGTLSDLAIPLPPLHEQRKIAEILRTWDETLEKLTALRAAKSKRHRGLTMALVFGGWQLDRFRTSDEVAPYRWFQLPASWSCQPIGDLAAEILERNGGGDQHEVLSCSKHDGFVRSLEYFKKQVFSADLTGYKKIWRGDFGFPSNHVEEGSIGLQNLTDIGVVSPIYTVFRFNPEEVNAEYAFAVLKTELYRHIFEVSTSASVDRRGSLRWSEFSRLPFPVPPLDEQEAIADALRTSQCELEALTEEIEGVSLQKRGLMQKLLTGEWRVDATEKAK